MDITSIANLPSFKDLIFIISSSIFKIKVHNIMQIEIIDRTKRYSFENAKIELKTESLSLTSDSSRI